MSYTDEELLECLRQLAETVGEPLTAPQCESTETTPSAATYQRRFGSWNAALEAAGLPINEENPSYTDDELIAALREFAERHGETPTYRQVNEEPELPSANVYKSRFDSWNGALQAASLDINQERSLTDEELITSLQEFAAELGHTPSGVELRNHEDTPSCSAYENRFGSWNDALRTAGLSVNFEADRYDETDEELLDLLRELAAELDTSPTQDDVDFAPDLPNSGVFADRFGGWNEAKQEAGLDTTHQPNRYTDRELLQQLRQVARRLEKSPTKAEIRRSDAPSPTTYHNRFNSWTAALEEAGLETPQQSPTQ